MHGWSEKGRTNVIGALLDKQLVSACLFKSTVDADVFYGWITQDLLPKAPEQSVIVMDNASIHKRKDICNAIQNAGHTLEFMPTYSPDLNPIENKWAYLKAIRRKLQCSVENLFKIESIYVT